MLVVCGERKEGTELKPPVQLELFSKIDIIVIAFLGGTTYLSLS
jgi:hypothetical protein